MRLRSLFSTTALRFTLLYTVLFSVFAALLLGFFYWTTTRYMDRQTDAAIAADVDGLHDEYRRHGLEGVRRVIERRSAVDDDSDRFYLLGASDYTPLAGNLSAWPHAAHVQNGWLLFTLAGHDPHSDDEQDELSPVRARHAVLSGGQHLLVGRNLHDREDLREHLLQMLFAGFGTTLLLALAGGLIMSRSMLRRIDLINRTSRAIMGGHLERRMPLAGSGDEFDQLAVNLNLMLDQIQRLMDGMRQVTDNVAHDLRSPLNRLRSRLEVTLLAPRDAPEYRAAIEHTLDDVEQLLATFNALLSIAQAEAGARRNAWEQLELSALLADVAELYQPLAEERGLRFTARIEPGLAVRGSRHLLAQAFGNLLDNAVKYTPAGGLVELVARRVQDTIEVEICDNGAGIPAAARERVLERFVRLDTSRSTPGSGLGLSLVRAVAHLHDARLELHDNQPGLRVLVRFSETSYK